MKKVGGLYFWNLGAIGGSFYLRKLPCTYECGSKLTAFGTLACGLVAVL